MTYDPDAPSAIRPTLTMVPVPPVPARRPDTVESLVDRAALALMNLRTACSTAGLPDDAHAVDLLTVELVRHFPMPVPAEAVEL